MHTDLKEVKFGTPEQYFMIIVDDHSRYTWAFPLKNKPDANKTYQTFEKWFRTQFGKQIKKRRAESDKTGSGENPSKKQRTEWETLSKKLREIGMRQLVSDPCVYTNGEVIINIHVDDLLILSTDDTKIDQVVLKLSESFIWLSVRLGTRAVRRPF
jgi:hypothetical protein